MIVCLACLVTHAVVLRDLCGWYGKSEVSNFLLIPCCLCTYVSRVANPEQWMMSVSGICVGTNFIRLYRREGRGWC